jgi:hypothetical protein
MSERARDTAVVWLVRLSVAAGVVWTAVSEWQLARIIGAPSWVAPALPLAIDAYVVAAVRAGRRPDLAFALAIMSCAQIAARLLDAGQVQVSVTLVAFVSILVPLTIWRVHALAETVVHANPEAESRTALAETVPNPAVTAQVQVPANPTAQVPNQPAGTPANQVPNPVSQTTAQVPNPAAPQVPSTVPNPVQQPTLKQVPATGPSLVRNQPKRTRPNAAAARPALAPAANSGQQPAIPPVTEQVRQILDLIDEHGFDTVKLKFVMDETGWSKTTSYNRLVEARTAWSEANEQSPPN